MGEGGDVVQGKWTELGREVLEGGARGNVPERVPEEAAASLDSVSSSC